MRVRVLGCSGGIYQGAATTSFLVDDDILVDAGTGAAALKLEEMRAIRHIFITHAHLDHIAALPMLADSVFDTLVHSPITVHALPATIDALQTHIFNALIWPDFTVLPRRSRPVLVFESMQPGQQVAVAGRVIEMIAVNHVVPGVAYRVESDEGGSFAFSGDTTTNESLWAALNRHNQLDLLLVESAFANKDIELARAACHYCPQLLGNDMARLKHNPQVGISHLRPGEEQLIMQECGDALPDWDLRQLAPGDVFELG